MTKHTKISLLAVFIAVGVWFFFTLHLAVSRMKAAAEARDSAELSSYVDFPALKESLKATFSAKLASEVTKNAGESPFAALGVAMAAAFINPMIDALVTPEGLAMMLKGEKPSPGKRTTQPTESPPNSNTSMSYESFDRFVVNVTKKGDTGEPVSFVFSRDGMISWKLSAIRMPN